MMVQTGNREMNGKWYLNHVRSELVFKCKWNKKLFSSKYTTMFEMAVTDRDSANVNKFKFRESAKMSDVFADQVNYFADEDFWGEFNFIRPGDPLVRAVDRLEDASLDLLEDVSPDLLEDASQDLLEDASQDLPEDASQDLLEK